MPYSARDRARQVQEDDQRREAALEDGGAVQAEMQNDGSSGNSGSQSQRRSTAGSRNSQSSGAGTNRLEDGGGGTPVPPTNQVIVRGAENPNSDASTTNSAISALDAYKLNCDQLGQRSTRDHILGLVRTTAKTVLFHKLKVYKMPVSKEKMDMDRTKQRFVKECFEDNIQLFNKNIDSDEYMWKKIQLTTTKALRAKRGSTSEAVKKLFGSK